MKGGREEGEAFHDEQLLPGEGDADKKGSNAGWKEVFVCICRRRERR